jgi:hypothetical protein
MFKSKRGNTTIKEGSYILIDGVKVVIKKVDYFRRRSDGSIDLIYYDTDNSLRTWDSRKDGGELCSE